MINACNRLVSRLAIVAEVVSIIIIGSLSSEGDVRSFMCDSIIIIVNLYLRFFRVRIMLLFVKNVPFGKVE